jgi:hypothetical protein
MTISFASPDKQVLIYIVIASLQEFSCCNPRG